MIRKSGKRDLSLSATQLKLIAVVAMVLDHIAWKYMEFFSTTSLCFHTIGRVTIPIMCYFIVQGYRNTSNLSRYILRLATFSVISILPFYWFFHEDYGYRQNIIFDLLLGLLVLATLEHKKWSKWMRCIIVGVLFVISVFLGGWPIIPILFILIFYYAPSWKWCSIWMSIVTVTLVVGVALTIRLNEVYHFANIHWVWYEKIYLIAFLFAIPLLRMYNGKRGCSKRESYFFYLFYPVHLFIIELFKEMSFSGYDMYVTLHVMLILACTILGIIILKVRASHAQTASVLFVTFSVVFMLGYLIELTTFNLEVVYAAIKIEYFGWFGFILAYTWFIDEFCHLNLPKWVYWVQMIVVLPGMGSVLLAGQNEWFYQSATMLRLGERMHFVMEPGPVFFVVYLYFGLVCLAMQIACIMKLHRASGIERKRYWFLTVGSFCPWISVALKISGMTGGYDIFSFGVLGIFICLTNALIRYGYYNSVQLAGENAIRMGREGILVVSPDYKILFINEAMQREFPELKGLRVIPQDSRFCGVLQQTSPTLSVGMHTYEMRIDTLQEYGNIQAYMIWAIDMTEHYENMRQIRVLAETDMLTTLHNRSYFVEHLEEYVSRNVEGSFFMLDMDQFKYVNDHYGHEIGDRVLYTVSLVMKRVLLADESEKQYPNLLCRLGGDEFCAYLSEITDEGTLMHYAHRIAEEFEKELREHQLPLEPSVSIGIAIHFHDDNNHFEQMYSYADQALYYAKHHGRATCHIYQEEN